MLTKRFSTAISSGLISPQGKSILVVGVPGETRIGGLEDCKVVAIQPSFPDIEALGRQGLQAYPEVAQAGGAFDLALVAVPRARARAWLWIGQAAAALGPDGLLVVDGAKTDGIDSLYKACKPLMSDAESLTKAHGRLFWGRPTEALLERAAAEGVVHSKGGFITAPGVFSADGPDVGSEALAAALPTDLKGTVVDLGAGWGYLSAQILRSSDVKTLHLVEADHMALTAARRNIVDPRAQFHWADATVWEPKDAVDAVVMNPPFHRGREGEPGLGRAFIATARRILRQSGQLWLVANRHLPYEQMLNEGFRDVLEMRGTSAFKIYRARRPKPK